MLERSASNLSDVANFSLANDNCLQRMTKPGEWGDGIMLASACRLYSRQINVVLAPSSGRKVIIPFNGDSHNPVYIGYLAHINHYAHLVPKTNLFHRDLAPELMATMPPACITGHNTVELCVSLDDKRVASVDPSNSQQSSESNSKLACCTEGQFPSSTSSSDFGAITENYDIGSLPNRHALSDDTRRLLLCACSKRSNDFQFPQTSGRRYNPSWETLFSWLRYSVSLDAAYCAPCFIFAMGNINAELD